jgi:rare lipoprotein A
VFPWSAYTETGLASWYGNEYNGRPTACGEIFNENDMTAAHKELPFGTVVRVMNLNNGLTVTVRINDRGPFIDGRIIDLTKAAAREIEMIQQGVVPVRLEILKLGT